MMPPARATAARPRLAILSFSTGEFDARSFRIADSALRVGWEVVVYARWYPGLAPIEERDGYRLIRIDTDGRGALPLVGRWFRRRRAAIIRGTSVVGARTDVTTPPNGPSLAPKRPAAHRKRFTGNPLTWPLRFSLREVRELRRMLGRWQTAVLMFPLRPLGWAAALDDVAGPADVWHGMWAGSLPALVRMRRHHGGRTVYDSRDVYMLSRQFMHLERPVKLILVGLERRWAHRVDQVLTVNDAYAHLLARQLRIPIPPVVPNTPNRWTPPEPPPDHIRQATGIAATTSIVLYQGQLISQRGIEQAMQAILDVPGTALVLLGYGSWEEHLRAITAEPPYAGRVFVLPAVPPQELLPWTASADVMVMPIQPTSINHEFTTPQKLWEAIAAGVPVVASDLPGMATVIRETGVGELCDPGDPTSIADAIRRLVGRPAADRAALRAHVLAVAHERHNWEAHLDTLFGLYERLGVPPSRPDWREAIVDAPTPAPAAIPGAPILESPVTASASEGPEAAGGRDPRPRLRFAPVWTAALGEAAGYPGTTVVLLDTAWIPSPAEVATGVVLLRDVVEAVMRERDLIAEASRALDVWASASGIAAILAHQGVSTWYGWRLGQWLWLLDELLWLAVMGQLLAAHPGTAVLELDAGTDARLLAAARLVAGRDGLELEGAGILAPAARPATKNANARAESGARPSATIGVRPGSLLRRIRRRLRPPEAVRRRRAVMARLAALEREPARRLLMVQAHARQRIETPAGTRHMNVYTGPVVDRLRGTVLEPIEVDIRSAMADDSAWARLTGPDGARSLPYDVVALATPDARPADATAEARTAAAGIAAIDGALVVDGVDLGPALVARMVDRIANGHGRHLLEVARIRGLLRRLHPAGILIADEYHRQDWLAAARAEDVPVAAIQHGVIYRWHTGYMHPDRTPDLGLPGRTYVYGPWERALLVATSVYAPEEVVVGGSPRLDLVSPGEPDRDGVRLELGIADGDRMVVLSGTWGPMYRQFHYPIALAALFAKPLDRVHVVVKLHPSERDEGPYRRIIEGVAAAGGFAPPPVTVVRDVDLYRLLGAADAHLGIHSTVLTEAVATGTPNLLATGLQSADLLGYLDGGVAVGVATAEDLAAALELPRDRAMDPARRDAFLRLHFEPGEASGRIANDLLEWLA